LKDKLDFDDDLLAELDVVVASLHVPANNEAENTKRPFARRKTGLSTYRLISRAAVAGS
jgi:histidinol phosphatase-like PHP family hydrolase